MLPLSNAPGSADALRAVARFELAGDASDEPDGHARNCSEGASQQTEASSRSGENFRVAFIVSPLFGSVVLESQVAGVPVVNHLTTASQSFCEVAGLLPHGSRCLNGSTPHSYKKYFVRRRRKVSREAAHVMEERRSRCG